MEILTLGEDLSRERLQTLFLRNGGAGAALLLIGTVQILCLCQSAEVVVLRQT